MHRLANTAIKLWRKSGSLLFLASACAVLLTSGCTSVPNSGPSDRFMVKSSTAQFFKYGPAQAFGPDFNLSKGQRVTMLNREFGYSKVKMDDGTVGYMVTDDLTIAPPDPPKLAAAAPTGGGWLFSGKPKRSDVLPTPSDPLFDVNDVPLPMPETSSDSTPSIPAASGAGAKPEFRSDKPQPGFRY